MTKAEDGNGIPPTYETLTKITRTENVSLSWLVDGLGPMFLIGLIADDALLAREVHVRAEDEPSCDIALLTDGEFAVVVFHQPAQLVDKRGLIEYRAVDVVAGPAGVTLSDAVVRLSERRAISVTTISPQEMREGLGTGWGSYQLFGDKERPGMIRPSTSRRRHHQGQGPFKVAEVFPPDGYSVNRAMKVQLMQLSAVMPDMLPDERTAITVMIEAITDRVAARKGE